MGEAFSQGVSGLQAREACVSSSEARIQGLRSGGGSYWLWSARSLEGEGAAYLSFLETSLSRRSHLSLGGVMWKLTMSV